MNSTLTLRMTDEVSFYDDNILLVEKERILEIYKNLTVDKVIRPIEMNQINFKNAL